jgi:hypothetical protein
LETHINKISSYHSDLYHLNQQFACVLSRFTKEDDTPENCDYIMRLDKVNTTFQETVDHLYVELGLVEQYPALASVDGNFVKTLLLCRDKKIEVRKAATSVLNEMLNLDDVHGGHNLIGNVPFLINRDLSQITHTAIATDYQEPICIRYY